MLTRRSVLSGLALAGTVLVLPPAQAAAALPRPGGKPILRVTGAISVRNDGDAAVFDRPMLEALGTVEIRTKTPWYTDRVRFEGVPMSRLMDVLGAKGRTLKVRALNDYESEIPISDFGKFNVILALKRDGHDMGVRDKGPLFIVYPYDSDPELQSQKYYSRSPWQIATMQVV